jgi:myo-inositol-1(or 4)-monophosphatase
VTSHEKLLELAVGSARAAARMIESGAARGAEVAATKSSDVDVVTETDRSAERLIRRSLLEARPDDAVLGEEGDDQAGTSGVRWIVDPIDGTVNFLYGIPQYAVSIAAELEGEVVAGVVLNAATGAEYTATLDGPALRSGAPIRVRSVVPLAERLVGTGFSYEADQRQIQAATLLHLLPRIRDIRRCARSPRGRWTPTSRRASTCGTTRRARWSPGPPEPGSRSTRELGAARSSSRRRRVVSRSSGVRSRRLGTSRLPLPDALWSRE